MCVFKVSCVLLEPECFDTQTGRRSRDELRLFEPAVERRQVLRDANAVSLGCPCSLPPPPSHRVCAVRVPLAILNKPCR